MRSMSQWLHCAQFHAKVQPLPSRIECQPNHESAGKNTQEALGRALQQSGAFQHGR